MSNAPYSPPSAPTSPEAAVVFAPLPLRPRGVLETIDVAVKLLRQYWKPMLAWSALANLVMVVASYFGLLVGPPLVIGPACCVLAAAVRGQSVGFKGCWRFTSPRVWSMIAMHVLSGIAAFVVLSVVSVALVSFSIWALSGLWERAWGLGLLLTVVGIVLFGLAASVAMAWHSMVSLVVCMEDEHRNTGGFKRAWSLLRGRWGAAVGLLSILNLALMVIAGALWAVFGLIMGTTNLLQALEGRSGDWQGLALVIGAATVSSWTIFTVFMPVNYLALALFYLDARVRHEALDLEWNAHQTHQATPMHAPTFTAAAPLSAPPQSFFSPVEAPPAPVLYNTPPSTSPAPQPVELAEPAPTSPFAPPETTAPPDTSSPFTPR